MFKLVPLFFISSAQHGPQTVSKVPLPYVSVTCLPSASHSKSLLGWPPQSHPLVQAQWFCSSLCLCLYLCLPCVCLLVAICAWVSVWLWLTKDSLGCWLVFFFVWDCVSWLPLDTSGWLAFELLWFSFLLPPCCRNTMIIDITPCPVL